MTGHGEERESARGPDDTEHHRGPAVARREFSHRPCDGAAHQKFPDQRTDQNTIDRRGVEPILGLKDLGDAHRDGPDDERPRRDPTGQEHQHSERGVEDHFVHERPRRADVVIRIRRRGQGHPSGPIGRLGVVQAQTHGGDCDQHHDPEERIEPPEAAEEITGERVGLAPHPRLGVGDDEPGDHEEEIDAGEADPAERFQRLPGGAEIAFPRPHVDAEDEQARDAAEALQIVQRGAHDR